MRHWGVLGVAGILAVAVGFPSSARAAMGGTIVQRTESAHYRLELDIGYAETMYTAAEAAKTHPTSGEIMVTGRMTGPMPGMAGMSAGTGAGNAMAMDWRHLELHVIDKNTGTAVEYAAVRITVTNTATGKRVAVPITQMYGLAEGFPDWHYGNNVLMPPAAYIIACEVNDEQVAFHVTVPAAAM